MSTKTAETVKKKPLAGKTLKAFELLDKNVDINDAYKLATGNNNPHPQTINTLKSKYEKHLLSKASTVKLASRVFVDTMKMKPTETKEVKQCPECRGKREEGGARVSCLTCDSTGVVNTLIYPSHTNRLAAAERVMDQVDPVVKKSMSLNIEQKFIEYDVTGLQD